MFQAAFFSVHPLYIFQFLGYFITLSSSLLSTSHWTNTRWWPNSSRGALLLSAALVYLVLTVSCFILFSGLPWSTWPWTPQWQGRARLRAHCSPGTPWDAPDLPAPSAPCSGLSAADRLANPVMVVYIWYVYSAIKLPAFQPFCTFLMTTCCSSF